MPTKTRGCYRRALANPTGLPMAQWNTYISIYSKKRGGGEEGMPRFSKL